MDPTLREDSEVFVPIKEDFVTKVSILITVGVKTVIMLKFIVEPYANAMM